MSTILTPVSGPEAPEAGPPESRATIHHRHARAHAALAAAARRVADRDPDPGLRPAQAKARALLLRDRADHHGRMESAALRLLNRELIAAGHAPSGEVTLAGHRYRVATPGRLAVHLGAALPEDLG